MTFAVQMWGSAINLNTSQCHISNVSTGCLFLTGFTQIRISDDCMTTIENIIKCQEITPTPLLFNVDSFHTNFINTTFQKKPQSSLNKFYETEISPLMQFSLHSFTINFLAIFG